MPAEVAATPGYAVSLMVRQRVERVFGWGQVIGLMRKTKRRGRTEAAEPTRLGFAAYNWVRMHKRLPLAPLPVTA